MAFKLIGKTEFSANVLTLMTGTAIAQAIPIAISPILSRIYSPSDFGIFGLFLAVVSIIAVAAGGRYEMAIMLPKKDEDAFNILALSVIISFVVSAFVFIFILIFQNSFISIFIEKYPCYGFSEIKFWLYLIPVSIFLMSAYQIVNYWSTRQKTFKMNASGRIGQSGVNSLTTLSMGFLTKGPLGLITGTLTGYATGFFVLSFNIFKNIKNLFPFITKAKLKENAITYKAFPIINAPPALLSTMQDYGILFIIAYFFSSFVVGCYSFVIRIMNIPLSLIGSSMYQVFYQKASSLYNNNENIQPFVKKLFLRSFLIGLPIFVLIFVLAPRVFAFVFGEEWRYAGELAQILTPWLFLNFIASPISSLPLITNNQKKAMYLVIIDISLRISALLIGGMAGSFKIGLGIMTISCSIVVLFALRWYYKLSGEVNMGDLKNT